MKITAPISLCFSTFAFVAATLGQAPAQQDPPPPNNSAVPVIQVRSQLVLLDIVAEDKQGRPVHGLKQSDFQIIEDNAPQAIRSFEEHSLPPTPIARPPAPKLPPGYFIDYSPVPSSPALTVVLCDALNTPIEDQAYVWTQLEAYLKHATPGTEVAIFGLANRLFLLQGFTSNPELLKQAILAKGLAQKSPLVEHPSGDGPDVDAMIDVLNTSGQAAATVEQMTERLKEFEADSHALQTRLRVQLTLNAFEVLSHYLAALPGRKNLIWFSGSFPTEVVPDPALADPFGLSQLDQDQFHRTINLFARSQIAIYPVDAHGLRTQLSFDTTNAPRPLAQPQFDPSNKRTGLDNDPTRTESDDVRADRLRLEEHSTMDKMAIDTGGRAFYNTNALSDAVSKTIDAGSTFYTVAYAPSNHAQNGAYRSIHVALVPSAASKGLKLDYRRGYFADKEGPHSESAMATAGAISKQQSENAMTAMVMLHGAPAPEELLFESRILPASSSTESSVASGNQLAPKTTGTGPFRRYSIDYVALPNQFTLAGSTSGRHTGAIECLGYVYDASGKLLVLDGRTMQLNFSAQEYTRFLAKPFHLQLELSAPVKTASFIRIGVRDVPSDRYGVIEVATDSVGRLPPPQATVRQ